IQSLSESGAYRGDPRSELVQIGLADDHRTSGTKLPDLERVAGRHEPDESHRTCGSLHVSGAVVILHDHRNSMEWPAQMLCCAFAIERVSFAERVRVECDQCIEPRSAMIKRLDSI